LGTGLADSVFKSPPTGRELARLLGSVANFPYEAAEANADLGQIASYYQEAEDRLGLVQLLDQTFDQSFDPQPLHFLLADQGPLLIVTTNYDDLIEEALRRRNRTFHLVVHPTDRLDLAASVLWWKPGEATPSAFHPSDLPLSLTDTTIIYKMHGSVDRSPGKAWSSFVVTEEDYVDFLARMAGQAAIPANFKVQFMTSRFLFLGYGLRDWNLRVLLKTIRSSSRSISGRDAANDDQGPHGPSSDHVPRLQPAASPLEGLRSWAIQMKPHWLETLLWRNRGVNIYDMSLDAFTAQLSEWLTRA
jgi:hypothetical protein